jgi:hypothetical protein
MRRELGAAQSMERVKESFLHHFAEVFGYSDIQRAEDGASRIENCNPPSSIFNP